MGISLLLGLSFVFQRHRRASLFFAPNRQQALILIDPLLTLMSARKPMLYVIHV